jgi:hypothetical protein
MSFPKKKVGDLPLLWVKSLSTMRKDSKKSTIGEMKMRWNSLYPTEAELIKDLMNIDIELYKRRWCRGFQFIESFQRYLMKHGKLTQKQMIQLKRLAPEIKKYHTWEF